MLRKSAMALLAMFSVTVSSALAESVASPAQQSAPVRAPDRPISRQATLVFREEWKATLVRPSGTPAEPEVRWEPTPFQHPAVQADVANPNLELKLYGPSGRQIQGGVDHLWTGLCRQTCAAALRDRSNFVDLSGFGKIRWNVRVSGLHRIHPIVKLADGTWLLGEHEDSNAFDMHPSEFTLAESRWIKLDIDNVVTLGHWLETSEVNLTRVDEIGFTDLMPGSGHGDGGWLDMGWIEVYGKAIPRTN